MPEKKAGVGGEEVRTEAGRIMGREYLALWAGAPVYLSFMLLGCLTRQKEISFERARRETFSLHAINSQGCSFSTAWQNSAEKPELL